MKLAVHVLGREVAVLEQAGDFRSVLSYHAGTAPDDFVSLTMPVRTESWLWDDPLPPVLQMGARLEVTSEIDMHHEKLRFSWRMLLANGTVVLDGIDFGELSTDGRLHRIVGFFGPLALKP